MNSQNTSKAPAWRRSAPGWVCCLATLLPLGAAVAAQGTSAGEGQPPALTAAQQQRLKERARLVAEVTQFWKEGKQAEAVAAWAKGVAADREVFGKQHEQVVFSLQVLARLH